MRSFILLLGFVLSGCRNVANHERAPIRWGYTTANFLAAVPVSVASPRKHIDFAKEHGLSFVELRDPDASLSPAECREIATHARRQGVAVELNSGTASEATIVERMDASLRHLAEAGLFSRGAMGEVYRP